MNSDNYWPDPLEKFELRDAVQARNPTVVLGGKPFNIRYDKETFYISPADGSFVPCGHFDYKATFEEIE